MMSKKWHQDGTVTRFWHLSSVVTLGGHLILIKAPYSSLDAKIDEWFRTRGNHIEKRHYKLPHEQIKL
jgi:hypothetical protein